MPKLFISHSSRDEELVYLLKEILVNALPITPADICCTTLRESRPLPGNPVEQTIIDELLDANAFIGVITENSLASQWVLFEMGARWRHQDFLLLLAGVDQRVLPNGPLQNYPLLRADQRENLHNLILRLHKSIGSGDPPNAATYEGRLEAFIRAIPLQGSGGGKVPVKAFLESKKRQPGEVFAIELLQHPVSIERDTAGRVKVVVDRSDVEDVLISNSAKAAAVEQLVTETNRKDLEQLDLQIQAFLTSSSVGPKASVFTPTQLQLRWASGGVLSIVSFADEPDRQWVPLFFRDIRPHGWNISLGSTQRAFGDEHNMAMDPKPSIEREWKNPARYIEREFLEESLVVVGEPAPGRTLPMKRFRWPGTGSKLKDRFIKDHLRLRKRDDDLSFKEAEENIFLYPLVTPCTLVVKRRGDPDESINDVLVCFSLLDLGIEVVRVVEYVLQPDEWLLDGEILDKRTRNGDVYQELVRMPIVFLSLDYLRRTFGQNAKWQNYTEGPQPSIEVLDAPKEDEIRFPSDWDVQQRLKIINSSPKSKRKKKEKNRHVLWYDMFRSNFLDENGKYWRKNASPLFIPGTAKILNLYFNLIEQPQSAKGGKREQP